MLLSAGGPHARYVTLVLFLVTKKMPIDYNSRDTKDDTISSL